jgi:exosortase
MWDPIRSLIRYASDLDLRNSSQIFLIPFVSAALVLMNRARILSQVRYSVLPGGVTLLFGLGLWTATPMLEAHVVEGDLLVWTTVSFLISWLGIFLFFYGQAAFKTALFPLLFLFFSVPIPSVILDPLIAILQHGSAELTYLVMKVSGTPVYRQGVLFSIPRLSFEIAPECSGINSFISMVILTTLAGNQLLASWWRRLVLVFVAIPIMLFKNALRISALVLLSIHVDPRIIESRLHREGGIPFFIVALLLLSPILTWLIKGERSSTVRLDSVSGRSPLLDRRGGCAMK